MQLDNRKANERRIEQLLAEVQDMKRQKVSLVKKMKEEGDKCKEKEV
jgi:hypothetical protein